MIQRKTATDEIGRPWELVIQQYEVERVLAERLKSALRVERPHLYRTLYEELLARVPHHPMAPGSPYRYVRDRSVTEELELLLPFTKPHSVVLEIGAGDLSLSRIVASRVKSVIAVDITDRYHSQDLLPSNLRFLLSDGISLDLEPDSVDVAYSNQLLEHFHPDDTEEHIRNVARALKPGAVYICITPHRWAGPHDVSRYFDRVSTGLHLKEYTVGELMRLFGRNGFREVSVLFSIRHRYMRVPGATARVVELIVAALPHSRLKSVIGSSVFQRLLATRVVAARR